MKFSIIIPVYNRAHLVKQNFDSLRMQNYPKSNYEIIYVDNNSSDNTKGVIEELMSLYSEINIQYVFEPRQGLVYARHSGAKAAKYDFLCYGDDDGSYDSNWLCEVKKVFQENSSVVAVGGKIVIRWDRVPPEWIKQYEYCLGKLDYGDNVVINSNIYINGGSFCIKKHTLLELGGFNPDQIGDKLIGDGEAGLCKKIHKAGKLIGWTPYTTMYHCQFVSKNATFKDIKRRFINNGICIPYEIFAIQQKSNFALVLNLFKALLMIIVLLSKQTFALLKVNLEYFRYYVFEMFFYTSQFPYTMKLLFSKRFRNEILSSNWF